MARRRGGQSGGGSICSMNSSRIAPGASTNAMRRVPKVPADRAGTPEHRVAGQLGVEVVDEEGGVQEPLVGQRAGVLVDRLGEQGECERAELDVGPAPVLPLDRLGHRGAGRPVPGARRLEIGDLDGQVGQTGDGHQCNGVP